MATFEFKAKVHVDDRGRQWVTPPVLGMRHAVRGSLSGREELVSRLARMDSVLERLQTEALVFPGGALDLGDFPGLVAVNSAAVRTFRVELDLSAPRLGGGP